jgi:L-fucono-1,5-lactonase
MTPAGAGRIDAHQHFWRYDAADYAWIDEAMAGLRRDYLPADAAAEMTRAGVGACVAVQARQSLEDTRWLLDLADAHPFILGVVGWVDLQSPGARRQLETFAGRPRLVGVRHIVQSEPDDRFMRRAAFRDGIALLEEFGLAYDILVYSRQLPMAIELVDHFPSQRFVLDHLGKPDIRGGGLRAWERDLRALASRPHVWAKLSGLVTEADWERWTPALLRPYLDVAFDAFGAARLMIGSDWPVCTLAADYQRTMRVVTDYVAGRPAHERDAVLGGTAQRFWNLRPSEATTR